MSLPAAVNRHHTAWIQCDGCAPHPFRYAVDGDRIVCFGDRLLGGAGNGRRVTVTVHEIAGGAAVAEFTGSLCDANADDIDANAILDLLEHVPLGRTPGERAAALAQHRTRRLVTVTAPPSPT
jgi:hypothetical protein